MHGPAFTMYDGASPRDQDSVDYLHNTASISVLNAPEPIIGSFFSLAPHFFSPVWGAYQSANFGRHPTPYPPQLDAFPKVSSLANSVVGKTLITQQICEVSGSGCQYWFRSIILEIDVATIFIPVYRTHLYWRTNLYGF